MRKITLTIILAFLFLNTCAVYAESIEGRFGLSGKAGAFVPLQDDFISSTSESKTGFAIGGGFIYGINKHVALELDVTHVSNMDVEIFGRKAYEASITDLSLAIQYRFSPENRLVPYIGAGVDFITGELDHVNGTNYDLDWTAGGHIYGGIDFFINKSIVLFADVRGIFAAEGNIERGDYKVGEYNPLSFVGTVGIRLFLPEKL